jgi:hypothetical protein
MAAFVALRASSILSFAYPTSTSDPPPTLITPTPPVNLANLYSNFSESYFEVVLAICYLICSILSFKADLSPFPFMMMVSSLLI